MLNQEDKQVMMTRVQENMADVYWEFRDEVSDEGGDELEISLDKLRDQIINIVEKFPA